MDSAPLLDKKYAITHEWYKWLTGSYEILKKHEQAKKLIFKPESERLIVEIGIYEGASTVWWADNFLEHENSKLISIDPFTGSEENIREPKNHPTLQRIEKIATKNVSLSKYPEKVDIHKGLSWDLYPLLRPEFEKGIDILYIDGAHDSLSVCRDVALYYPHLKPGGALIFDDYGSEKVKMAADACMSLFGKIENAFYTGWQLWCVNGNA
jgi:hypothetical protein